MTSFHAVKSKMVEFHLYIYDYSGFNHFIAIMPFDGWCYSAYAAKSAM